MMTRGLRLLFLIVALATTGASSVPGPMPVEVLEVKDGDTLKVRVNIWLNQYVIVSVRVLGVDTPEMRAKCRKERIGAEAAKEFVKVITTEGVTLRNVKYGKYAGRVLAEVYVNDIDLAELLITNGLGRAYSGGKREGWCSG